MFSLVLSRYWRVEFVSPPQHETSYDPETTTKEDFN